MSSLADRLRSVVGPRGQDARAAWRQGHQAAADDGSAGPACDVARVLGGEWRDAGGERYLVVERAYAPGHRHGHMTVADGRPPGGGLWPRLAMLLSRQAAGAGAASGRLLFIDLETTGLAGGAGTYAFLVGCAWFDGDLFRIRQFFLSSFAAERPLLQGVASLAEDAGALVTYNGASFDLPVIETRFVLHRLPAPFGGVARLDMLHPARRFWRSRDDDGEPRAGCRLTVIERALCGYVRDGDVSGVEIPSRYFHYVHGGDPLVLGPVFEHNRLDLLSLALVTARAAQLVESGAGGATTPSEALGLGGLYERSGWAEEARCCYERAAAMAGRDPWVRAHALRALARLARRERRHRDAASAWTEVLALPACPLAIRQEAAEALAVHFEHRLREPARARRLVAESLAGGSSPARRRALEHRLTRLDRKLGERLFDVR